MNNIERIEIKELRLRILKALDYNYPTGLSEKLVARTLAAAYYEVTGRELTAQLAYMKEKGYIELEQVGFEDLGLERRMVRLTAKGKDLVDGNTGDPGVGV